MASEIKEFESQPSQSQRADPLQSQSAAQLNKVYVFFWHAYSSVMYSLYEIEVPKHLPPRPDKATQADEIENPKKLLPVLQLKTGQYPDGMSCVSLGSKLYFFGGEFNMDNPYIGKGVKKNLKDSKRDVFPRQVLILDLSEVGASGDELHKLLRDGERMRSGKARPHAFVAEEKIYVIGSTIESSISHRSKLTRLNLESFIYFEVYNPEVGQWHDLPDPPIGNVKTRWVGHAIVRKQAVLVAWQGGKERLYCFDLDERRWIDASISIPFYPENFSGRTEFVEDTLYGCYHNTIAAIAPKEKIEDEKKEKKRKREKIEEKKVKAEQGENLKRKKVKAEQGEKLKRKKVKAEEGERMEEKKVEAEKGEKMEAEKVKAKETVEAEEEEEDAKDFAQGWLLENLLLHVLSEEMGMDAIFNVPRQLQASSSLLHLGNRYFCYVKSGMPPNSDNDSDDVTKDDKKRFISIVIFQALGKKYEKDGTGLLQAQFLYSAHYEINSPVPIEGFISGCFFPGSVYLSCPLVLFFIIYYLL